MGVRGFRMVRCVLPAILVKVGAFKAEFRCTLTKKRVRDWRRTLATLLLLAAVRAGSWLGWAWMLALPRAPWRPASNLELTDPIRAGL